MPQLLMFSTARQAAGRSEDNVRGTTLDVFLANAIERYGDTFAAVVDCSRVWVNGEAPTGPGMTLTEHDEIAIIPPISGG
ncbi:hypothetical protein CH306_26085 [Rhodococcus sp. 15-725-2-2b]|uniref:MoaD/ThiS family protein n=1 Tax=unclassified Rhodococcus (in: high G+C Gram-positive bacteria) TaxID=192944 RepID=UPI000B9B5F22|nr:MULTISPECIES: MoaD/ThiS family protein [unclassified Rhodococcus (in: high G+C Gram-positive bacteria)]OZC63632.1 hypothetical protein CH277_22575 [Rhodococcus sp. 06-469-3-2]OZD40797.1 hypothetical protein CH264_24260 [Rhodococcus sp. 06-1477-1A]OZE67095.1 hypothetical protein CH306_26085 [Rhodococcus sp. 15-725-2-2b]